MEAPPPQSYGQDASVDNPFIIDNPSVYSNGGGGGGGFASNGNGSAVITAPSVNGSDLSTMDEEEQNFEDFENLGNGGNGGATFDSSGNLTGGWVDYANGQSEYVDPTTGQQSFYDTNTNETTTVNADGSGSYTNDQGTIVWDAAGNVDTYTADGGVMQQDPTGAGSYTDPQGRVTYFDANGVLLSYTDPTTGYSYINNGKTWTETQPDGLNCSGDFTGNYCCSDGTCTPGWQDKATSTQYQRTPGPTSGGSGGGGSLKPGSTQQATTNPLANAKIPTLTTIPGAQTAAQQYAQQMAAQRLAAQQSGLISSSGLNLGGGTISWTWLLIGGLLIFALSKK